MDIFGLRFGSEKIKELRIKNGISQRALGEHLGISDKAVSKWETGLSVPSSANLIALSKLFGVSIEYFYGAAESKKHAEPICDGMESITELYKIGRGPSSSHTIGPEKACMLFKEKHKSADRFKVVLYGSLAKTGRGHGTDVVIKKTFSPKTCDIEFNCIETELLHPNTMELTAYEGNRELECKRVMSVGGGSVVFEGTALEVIPRIYTLSRFDSIYKYCKEHSLRLWEYAQEVEGKELWQYLSRVWVEMKSSIKRGLNDEGILPGGLEVHKKASSLYNSQHIDETVQTRENRIVCAYAFAVSEQNASGETIVTAPTCGAAGVLPAVLYYHQQKHGFEDVQILRALATAGIIGNLIKTNASISGAECGCQAEIGSACAMAAAALAELYELSIDKIEYAAEIAIEHHLGLTCDPICGLVQIPCIERNAVAAMRAINAVNLSSFLWNTRKISFDKVVETMRETGRDMNTAYKETSEAGLAKISL